jgi:hypothetical protein
MAPAVGILIARRLEMNGRLPSGYWLRGVVLGLVTSLVLGLAVLQGDYLLAAANRQNAQEVCADYQQRAGALWFQGHWGFQFYMSHHGAAALDFKSSVLRPGDAIAVPSNNTNLLPPDPRKADLVELYKSTLGAGFYASVLGPLPFVFGHVPPEVVAIYILKPMSQATLSVPK